MKPPARPPREREIRLAKVRIALGTAQMGGAASAVTLLAITGMSPWSLGMALFTCIVTMISLVLFRNQD